MGAMMPSASGMQQQAPSDGGSAMLDRRLVLEDNDQALSARTFDFAEDEQLSARSFDSYSYNSAALSARSFDDSFSVASGPLSARSVDESSAPQYAQPQSATSSASLQSAKSYNEP